MFTSGEWHTYFDIKDAKVLLCHLFTLSLRVESNINTLVYTLTVLVIL